MAKTVTIPTRRTIIGSPYFEGFLDQMPQEAKDRMKESDPNLHKIIFGEEVQSGDQVQETTPDA